MNLPYDYWPSNPIATNVGRIPHQKLNLAGQVGSYFDSTTSDPADRRNSIILDKAKITTVGNQDEFSMFEIPKMPELFRAKLKVSSEIEALLSSDICFNYVLNSIFNIIDESLNEAGNTYSVNVSYKIYNETPEWKRALVFVHLDNIHFDATLDLWKKVGDKVEEFFNSLKKKANNIWPPDAVDKLNDLISIEFDSGD